MSSLHQALLMGIGTYWNPNDKDADVTLSGGNLIATLNNTSGSIQGLVRAITSHPHTVNKYFVVEHSGQDLDSVIGIGTIAANLASYPGGPDGLSVGYIPYGNLKYRTGSPLTYADRIEYLGVMVDFDAGTIRLKRQGKFYTTSYSFTPNTTLYPMWGPSTGGAGTFACTIDGACPIIGLDEGYSAWTGAWNPSDKSANVTLSGSDLIATVLTGGGSVRGAVSKNSGKWGFELKRNGEDRSMGGVGTSSASLAAYPGFDANGWSYWWNGNTRRTNDVATAMPGQKATGKTGLHLNNDVITFIPDGTIQSTFAYSGITGTLYPMWGSGTSLVGSRSGTAQFDGVLPWIPAGATPWG